MLESMLAICCYRGLARAHNRIGLQRPEDSNHPEVPGPLGDAGNCAIRSEGVAEDTPTWWGFASQPKVRLKRRKLRQEEPNSTPWSI